MSIVGSLCLLVSTLKSPDGDAIRQHGFFYAWTPLTMVMILRVVFTLRGITMLHFSLNSMFFYCTSVEVLPFHFVRMVTSKIYGLLQNFTHTGLANFIFLRNYLSLFPDPSYFQCPWRNSCRPSDQSCWRC